MPLSFQASVLLHPSTLLLTFSGVSVLVLLGIQFGSGHRILDGRQARRLKDSSDDKTPRQTVPAGSDTVVPKRTKLIHVTLDSVISLAIQRWKPSKPIVPLERPVGLLVTAELEDVLAACKAKVERISRECRADNRKFR